MNEFALESFIDFCDNMEIAQEGQFIDGAKKVKKFLSKKTVSIKSATDVSTKEQLLEEMEYNTPLIHLIGERSRGLVKIFKNMKGENFANAWNKSMAAYNGNATAMAVYASQGNKPSDAASDYRYKEFNGEAYIVRNDYNIAEAKKK